jgi:hypothetical protein
MTKLQFGEFPVVEETAPETQGWQTIRSPAGRWGYLLAMLVGLVILNGVCLLQALWSFVIGDLSGYATAAQSTSPWVAVVLVLVAYIPLHEALHLLGQPGWGRSDQSVVILWPAKLRFGVYYEGCMSRRRWLAMRLVPVVALSVLPAALLALMKLWPLNVELEIGLQVLMLVNAVGSGGDVVAAALVLRQVPRGGELCFRGGRAYWRGR